MKDFQPETVIVAKIESKIENRVTTRNVLP
jgi:hypothetical protein